MRIKNANGSFRMSDMGEVDMRGIYIAIVISEILNISTPKLRENVAEFIASC